MAEIVLRQNDCSASENSAIAFSASVDGEGEVYERFVYTDVSHGVRDRLMIAYSDGNDNSAYWKTQQVSEETGLLDKASRSTGYFTMLAEKIDDELTLTVGDTSISAVSEMGYIDSGTGMNKMKITSHSSDVSIDSIKIKSLIKVTGINLETDKTPVVGEVSDISLFGYNWGRKYKIYHDEYRLTYDEAAVRIEGDRITFLKSGKTVIEAEIESRSGEILTDRIELDIKECRELYIEAPQAVLLNSTNSYRVINNDGNVVECDVFSDTLEFSDNTFYAGTPGNHNVNILYCGKKIVQNIFVSEYEEIDFVLPGNVIKNESAQFILRGKKSGKWNDISYDNIIYDKARADVTDNNFILKKYGETEFTIICDGIKITKSVFADEESVGEIFFEDFENEPVYDGFIYNLTDKEFYQGSTMLMLDNCTSETICTDTYFKISGRVCVDKIYDNSYMPFWGINLNNEKHPIVCSISDYIRIGGISGEERVDITDGEMHSFSVLVSERGIEFSVDGITRTSYADFGSCNGFSFSAGGMKAYIDDIRYEKLVLPGGTPDKIEAVNKKIILNRYESYSLEEINGIRAVYNDSYRYLSDYNTLSRSIIRGGKYAGINNGIISFDKYAPENTLVRIQAEYKNFSCTYDIILTSGSMTNSEYLKCTAEKRRRDFIMRILGDANKEISLKVTSGDLLPIYTRMIMEPYARDYTEDIKWHIRMTDYSEKISGSADGAGDFGLLQAIRCYYQLKGKVKADDDVFDEILRYVKAFEYPGESAALSENHRLVYYICEQLGAELTGRTSAKEKLINFFDEKLRNGFMEEASPHYTVVDLFALETLYMFTKDSELKLLSYDMATLIYAKQLINSIDSSVAGAVMREYPSFGKTMTFLPGALMFGEGLKPDESYPVRNIQLSGILFSDYTVPDILFDIASGREYPYEYRTSSRIYSYPFDEAIKEKVIRYSYITDRYAVGAVVHTDNIDKYKKKSGSYLPVVAGHQEIPWSIGIKGNPKCLIIDSHPGNTEQHRFFSGDIDCLCYEYLQDKNVSLGMHKIDKNDKLRYIHMLIPKRYYDACVEEKGWIFLEKSGVYIALKLMADGEITEKAAYKWGEGIRDGQQLCDIEAVINSTDTAFVCEIGDDSRYETFDKFRSIIIQNTKIDYTISGDEYYISYKSADGNSFKIDRGAGKKYINDIEQSYDNYPVVSSPYLECADGTAKIIYGGNYYEMKVE